MPQRDDDPAEEHAAVLPQPAVRNDAAEDGGEPDAPRIRAIDGAGMLVVEAEGVDHVEDEERPHPVVAEALPHLREEERGETAGVAGPAGGVGVDARCV